MSHGAYDPQQLLTADEGQGGSGGMGASVLPPTHYTATTRMTALRRAAV